jgi:hypothetical protein
MHKLTRRLVRQLSTLSNPLEKRTLHLKGIDRSHVAGALVVTALVETTFEIAAGLLLDGLSVISRDGSISSEATEGENEEHLRWNNEL